MGGDSGVECRGDCAVEHGSTYACGRIFAWAQKGTNSARGVKFRAQLLYNNVYVQRRPRGINVVFVRMSCELISLRSPTVAWFAAPLS